MNQLPASVTPNLAGKIYGAVVPTLTGTLNGFLPSDNVTATYSRTAGETVAGSPYTISATLSPQGVLGNYNITYNTANFTITAASTTTTISSVNPSPATVGQPATVTVAVAPIAPGAGTPTGTVTVGFPGAPTSCTATLPANSCMLTLTSSGPQSITATYNGDSNFKGSPSSAFPVTVKPSLVLLPGVLAGGDQGVLYQAQLLAAMASGGTPPYGNWSWTPALSSALPPGLSLSPSAGTITGTPTATGTYTFIVGVMDSLGAMASQTYSITVNPPPSLTGGTLPNALVGTPYSYNIPAMAGTPPFSNWTCSNCAANLPAGLSFSNGNISGAATGTGTGNINVSLSDAAGGTATAMYTITADTVTSVGFTGPYQLQNWSASASNGGTTTITPPSGPSTSAQFAYSINLGGGGVSARTWTLQDTAAASGTVSFNWQYTGFHAYFDVTALLQVFDASNVVTLYSAGPANCCTSPSGGFSVSGTATINVNQGDTFGWIVGGSNFDSNSVLQGTLTITNFSTPLSPAAAAFSLTGPLNTARENHTATLLSDGTVPIAGGANSSGLLGSAELYNPMTGTFAYTPPERGAQQFRGDAAEQRHGFDRRRRRRADCGALRSNGRNLRLQRQPEYSTREPHRDAVARWHSSYCRRLQRHRPGQCGALHAITTANITHSIDLTGLVLKGSAAVLPAPVLTLTNDNGGEASSAWLTTEQSVASSFSASFDFRITPAEYGPNSIADGFAL